MAEPSASLFAARQPLFDASEGAQGQVRLASLFMGKAEGGLFAALPGRLDAPMRRGGGKAAQLHDLIARAEAGTMGYDAVQHGARVKPPKRPTRMTLGEIYAWIRATPGQPHAIGRYQFIPATLRHSAKRLGLPPKTRFSPEVQDRLANLLLGDAGFLKVQKDEMTAEAFMLNLAKIWAGLPLPSGRSYYQGYAGNKATMDYAVFAREVRAILDG
ncbi:hypothetical protein [Roseovarius sp. MMSF_3281]|uniref:hypothetical protein n=1 Tax=Roseovarius sp. MMSF_3281 TaxID=3046694 RepID=UPI00273E704B|nr:hypothetical protein [Roseovarius sp. MMSF_3281]